MKGVVVGMEMDDVSGVNYNVGMEMQNITYSIWENK